MFVHGRRRAHCAFSYWLLMNNMKRPFTWEIKTSRSPTHTAKKCKGALSGQQLV